MGEMTWMGSPFRTWKVVCRASWRSITSAKARRIADTSTVPSRRIAEGML
ncbi:hypothetical protein COSO111634_31770 [Corallococcus soli]